MFQNLMFIVLVFFALFLDGRSSENSDKIKGAITGGCSQTRLQKLLPLAVLFLSSAAVKIPIKKMEFGQTVIRFNVLCKCFREMHLLRRFYGRGALSKSR